MAFIPRFPPGFAAPAPQAAETSPQDILGALGGAPAPAPPLPAVASMPEVDTTQLRALMTQAQQQGQPQQPGLIENILLPTLSAIVAHKHGLVGLGAFMGGVAKGRLAQTEQQQINLANTMRQIGMEQEALQIEQAAGTQRIQTATDFLAKVQANAEAIDEPLTFAQYVQSAEQITTALGMPEGFVSSTLRFDDRKKARKTLTYISGIFDKWKDLPPDQLKEVFISDDADGKPLPQPIRLIDAARFIGSFDPVSGKVASEFKEPGISPAGKIIRGGREIITFSKGGEIIERPGDPIEDIEAARARGRRRGAPPVFQPRQPRQRRRVFADPIDPKIKDKLQAFIEDASGQLVPELINGKPVFRSRAAGRSGGAVSQALEMLETPTVVEDEEPPEDDEDAEFDAELQRQLERIRGKR